jgi:hypothetical protein
MQSVLQVRQTAARVQVSVDTQHGCGGEMLNSRLMYHRLGGFLTILNFQLPEFS